MGFLEAGSPMTWEEVEQVIKHIHEHGIEQLLNIWRVNRDRTDDISKLKWGDEVEMYLTQIDDDSAKVLSAADQVLDALNVREKLNATQQQRSIGSIFYPEFGNHMVEALPSPAYSFSSLDCVLEIEPNMRLRRAKIQAVLNDGEYVASMAAFPRFGLQNFMSPELFQMDPDRTFTGSVFIPEELVSPHPRFGTLVRNIRHRRKANPVILIPLELDKYTYVDPVCDEGGNAADPAAGDQAQDASSGTEDTQEQQRTPRIGDSGSLEKDNSTPTTAGSGPMGKITTRSRESKKPYMRPAEADWSKALPKEQVDRFVAQKMARYTVNPVKDFIYMDCFAFGMGQNCLQATFGTHSLEAARFLVDQVGVVAPLFLALTAATPALRGLLSAYDTRWSVIEQAVDCRRQEEMETLKKSRYSGFSLYISDSEKLQRHKSVLNDVIVPQNADVKKKLLDSGMDETFATHFAYLWMRDPIVVFHEKLYLDDTKASDHFENIQCTNWNSVRFKPPPPTPDGKPHAIGWRVELRTPEVQLTDFENSAVVAVAGVLARLILANKDSIDLYIPMSLNDENMRRSWVKDAVTDQKFWFRNDVYDISAGWSEMTLHEILNGKPGTPCRGLLNMCKEFLQQEFDKSRSPDPTVAAGALCSSPDTLSTFHIYCRLLQLRASGKLPTIAQFLRRFITKHPDYRQDSVVTPSICRDITVLSANIGFGVWVPSELYGELSAYIARTPLAETTRIPKLGNNAVICPKLVRFHHCWTLPQRRNNNNNGWAHSPVDVPANEEEQTASPSSSRRSTLASPTLDDCRQCAKCGRLAEFSWLERPKHPLRSLDGIYQLTNGKTLCSAACRQVCTGQLQQSTGVPSFPNSGSSSPHKSPSSPGLAVAAARPCDGSDAREIDPAARLFELALHLKRQLKPCNANAAVTAAGDSASTTSGGLTCCADCDIDDIFGELSRCETWGV